MAWASDARMALLLPDDSGVGTAQIGCAARMQVARLFVGGWQRIEAGGSLGRATARRMRYPREASRRCESSRGARQLSLYYCAVEVGVKSLTPVFYC